MTQDIKDVTRRMETIMQVFLSAQSISEREQDHAVLVKELDRFKNEYRSVAYEAASMTIALRDLDHDVRLSSWFDFTRMHGSMHLSQIHAGLGWALAQKRIFTFNFIQDIGPLLQLRIYDGFGYYDGIFRNRASVVRKIIPEEFSTKVQAGYDQGIGRGLYYSAKGEPGKFSSAVSEFEHSRQADLWRGVGIACVYVGGTDEKTLQNIFFKAGQFQSQLRIAATLVARARRDADAMTPFTESACRLWCGCSSESAAAATVHAGRLAGHDVHANQIWMDIILHELDAMKSERTRA